MGLSAFKFLAAILLASTSASAENLYLGEFGPNQRLASTKIEQKLNASTPSYKPWTMADLLANTTEYGKNPNRDQSEDIHYTQGWALHSFQWGLRGYMLANSDFTRVRIVISSELDHTDLSEGMRLFADVIKGFSSWQRNKIIQYDVPFLNQLFLSISMLRALTVLRALL